MWPKHFVAVCLVATVVFAFTGQIDAAPTKGCKKSVMSLSQEAGLEAQALTDPDEDKVYHTNSVDDITFMKKKSTVEKRSDEDDDCEGVENGAKKENIVHLDVKPIPKSGIIKLDTDNPQKFVESVQIDADDSSDKKVKKSSDGGLVDPQAVARQKERIKTLQASIHQNLVKLFHHLKHSHPQNSLADQEEVAQAKEALIADAKRMTALNHDPSPAENFLSGLSNNSLIAKMLKNKKKPNVISLDNTPGNVTGNNTNISEAKTAVKEDSSFEVKTSGEAKPAGNNENSSNVEIKTSGDVKTSGDGSTKVEVKSDGQSSFNAEGGNKGITSQGSAGTEIKTSSTSDSIDMALKSSNDEPEGNKSKVDNEDNNKVALSEKSSSSNSNKTVKLGKFSLDKKEDNVTKIKVKEVKEKESDEKPIIKHDPYAEIAASPDDPKMPPNIKLPKEGPYIPVGIPKNGDDDDDDDDEPPRDKEKEREKDRGRGGGGGGAPFVPPPGDFAGQSEAPGQNDLSMAGTVNPDLADKGILNSFRTEAIQAQLQDQIQQQALEGQMMRGMNGMMGRGRMASAFGGPGGLGGLEGMGGMGGMHGMGGMGGMHGMGGMGMGGLEGMGAMGGMANMAGMAGMADAAGMGGIDGPRMAGIGGMGNVPGGMGGMAGGMPGDMGGLGGMGGMEGVGGMGSMGYARSMDGYGGGMNGIGRMPEMAGDMDFEGAYGRRDFMPEDQPSYGGQYGYDEGPRYPSMMEERGVSRNIVPGRYAGADEIRSSRGPMYNPRYFNDDDDDGDDGPEGDGPDAVAATQRDREPDPHRYEDFQGYDDDPDEDYDSEDERKTKIAKAGKLSKVKTKSVKKKLH